MPPDSKTSTGLHKVVHDRLLQLPVFARELLAGGAAGGLAKTCVAPLERTKIIFQTRGGSMTVSGVLQHIWNHEGLPGLFRGNTASVLRIVPYAAIHFGSYEYIRRFIVDASGAEKGHGPDARSALPVYDLLAGSASGAIAVMATYPLDLVRTRLAWATEAPAKQQLMAAANAAGAAGRAAPEPHLGIWSILHSTFAEEGVAGLYRGCAPTLLGILPYAGLKFYVYQTMKNHYRTRLTTADKQQQQQLLQQQQQQQQPWQSVPTVQGPQQEQQGLQKQQHTEQHQLPPPPPFETAVEQAQAAEEEQEEQQRPQKLPVAVTLVFGGVAGLVAQTVTYPLDVIRRQMQVSHLQIAAQARSSRQTTTTSSSSSSSSADPGKDQAGSARTLSTSSSTAHSSSSSSRGSSLGSNSSSAGAIRAVVRPTGSLWQQQIRGLSSPRYGPPGAAAQTAVPEPSMHEVAVRLWRSGGLFRGLSINYLKVVPSTAIGFTVYDWMKAYLGLSHS